MKYSPKSIYRVHRVAWGAYKRVWRGGFSPVQSEREIVQGLANGMMENRQKNGNIPKILEISPTQNDGEAK